MIIATLIPQLEAIGKAAEARRVEIETQRKIPDDIIQQLKASGVLRLWTAKAYGGHQAHVLDLLEAIQTLAYFNGSIAWIAAVTGTASLASGYLNQQACTNHLWCAGCNDRRLGCTCGESKNSGRWTPGFRSVALGFGYCSL